MVNGKQKGNGFERKVAKKLTEWCGQKFNRTPMSGALRWDNDKRVVSDIVPPQSMKWPFSVECKCVESSWEFNTLLENTATLWKHWEQADSDAQREDMIPMLVFTKNYRNDFVAVYQETFSNLQLGSKKSYSFPYILVNSPTFAPVVVTHLDSFLSFFEISDIQKLCN